MELEEIKKLDKYYTSYEMVFPIFKSKYNKRYSEHLYVEPSAGDGSLVRMLETVGIKNILAYDLVPEHEGIVKQDFFELDVELLTRYNRPIITLMNPPFGFSGNLAIKFFNKAATYSNQIWGIFPKTFKKDSIKDKLDLFFHLKYEIDLPKNSFLLDGLPYNVPCCYQIWSKKKNLSLRKKSNKASTCEFFEFVNKKDATHAIRRVGGKAGKLLEGIDHTESSTYFIKVLDESILDDIKNIDVSLIINSTVGVRSISKSELVSAILKARNERLS